MRFWISPLVLCAAVAAAPAHFVWVVPNKPAAGKAQVIFSDSLEPDSPDLLERIARTEVFVRGEDGKNVAVKKEKDGGAFVVTLPGKGPQVVGAALTPYGVFQRGDNPPVLLNYYAKALVGGGKDGLPAAFEKPCDNLPLDVVPMKEVTCGVRVLWQGKPLADAEVVVMVPGKDKDVTGKTDRDGRFVVEDGKAAGLYGFRVLHNEAKAGEKDGKKFAQIRHYATLVLAVEGAKGQDNKAGKADPAATKLLADARAARANWVKFPGFTADVEVNLDGRVARGTLQVNAGGKVELKLDGGNAEAEAWARRQLSSLVAHRIDGAAEMQTPCAFGDDNAAHPLGRAVRVLNDELHSSYRIRDRQIIEVNRQMPEVRFTIAVLENHVNEEKQFLPACYVVNTWDRKTDALKSSDTHHQTWQRVGKFDLPRTVTVVTATAGKLEARSIKLSNLKLTP